MWKKFYIFNDEIVIGLLVIGVYLCPFPSHNWWQGHEGKIWPQRPWQQRYGPQTGWQSCRWPQASGLKWRCKHDSPDNNNRSVKWPTILIRLPFSLLVFSLQVHLQGRQLKDDLSVMVVVCLARRGPRTFGWTLTSHRCHLWEVF